MGKKYTTQNNSTNTSEITHNHKQKQRMTVDHTLVLLFIDQSIAITWTRPNLCKSNFRIIAHALTFKIHKWLHNKYKESSNTCDHRLCGCDLDNVASCTWPTSWERPEHGLDRQLRASRVVRLLQWVALATRANRFKLPTSGLPMLSFYPRIWLRCHFRCEANVDLQHIYIFGYPFGSM